VVCYDHVRVVTGIEMMIAKKKKKKNGNDRRRGHAADPPPPNVESIIKLIRPSTLTMPQLTPQRDSSALAASSTASGSAFYDTRDPPSDKATVRGRDTGSQMPYTTDYRVRAADSTSCDLC
jgi:hypothetical protein